MLTSVNFSTLLSIYSSVFKSTLRSDPYSSSVRKISQSFFPFVRYRGWLIITCSLTREYKCLLISSQKTTTSSSSNSLFSRPLPQTFLVSSVLSDCDLNTPEYQQNTRKFLFLPSVYLGISIYHHNGP